MLGNESSMPIFYVENESSKERKLSGTKVPVTFYSVHMLFGRALGMTCRRNYTFAPNSDRLSQSLRTSMRPICLAVICLSICLAVCNACIDNYTFR